MRTISRTSATELLARTLGVTAVSLGVLTSTTALADTAGSVTPAHPRAHANERAQRLLSEDQPVAARATLMAVLRGTELDTHQRGVALDLLAQADARVKRLSPGQLSLQSGELAMSDGDLLTAERHARAVVRGSDASLSERAAGLLSRVASRRASLAPTIPGMIDRASSALNAGRGGEARALLSAVERSGVPLSEEQHLRVQRLALRSAGMPEGESPSAGLALREPGVMRGENAENEPSAPEDAPQPIEPAAREQVQSGNTAPAAPSSDAAPAQPAVSTQDQLIQLALKADAQRLVAEGDNAMVAGRYSEASGKFEQALSSGRAYLSAEEIAKAEGSLSVARSRLGSNLGGNLGESVLGTLSIARDRATAEFENELQQSRAALDAGDVSKAQNLAARAASTVERNSEFLPQGERDAMLKRADAMRQEIATRSEQLRASEAARQAEESKRRSEQAQTNLRAERDRKIVESIQRARSLQREMKYNEAIQIIDQVLFLDPTDPTALMLRDTLHDLMVYTEHDKLTRERGRRMQIVGLENDDALLQPKSIMVYPSDWPTKTHERTQGAAYNDSPENQRALSRLEQGKVPAQFDNSPLGDVLAYIGSTSGVNVDADWNSLKGVGVEPRTPVSLRLASDVPAKVVLEKVLAKAARDAYSRPDFAIDNGIVTVASADAVKRHVTTGMYSITDLMIDAPNYTETPQVDLVSATRRSSALASPFDASEALDRPASERAGRDARVKKVVELVQRTVDPDSWREHGGDVGSIQELNGSLIITTTPKNHREIVGILSKLREIRSLQVSVESRFLLVNSNFFEQIGMSLNVTLAGNRTPLNTQTSTQAVNGVITQSGFSSSVGAIGTLPQPGQEQFRVARGATGGPGSSGISQIPITSNSLGVAEGLASSSSAFTKGILNGQPALGLAVSYLDDIQVDFLLKATQADQRLSTLNAPRLTITNGQIANVYVTTQTAYVSGLNPISSQGAVAFTPVVSTVNEGVTMLVEAVVSADRRYITMNIDTALTSVDKFNETSIQGTVAGQAAGQGNTGTASATIQLPILRVTRVQTTSTVPDQGTLLLGGQRQIVDLEVESGVPVLSKIPIINRFFTNTVTSKEERTLMILVKPTVIIQAEQEEKNFPGLNDTIRGSFGG